MNKTIENMEKKLHKDVIALLRILKKDAQMALNGEWDKSDEGFQCQIKVIDDILKQLKFIKQFKNQQNDTRNNKNQK